MANVFAALTDGTYTFEETGVRNRFYFRRNDGRVLHNVGNIPLVLFSTHIVQKTRENQFPYCHTCQIHYEKSVDGKLITMTVSKKQEQ